ncbi:MAG: hypothetical protein M0P13_04495 [Fibrobacteraceae bacterium]|nr:hypothetical protein [Fibrobacteraceae bacterium]
MRLISLIFISLVLSLPLFAAEKHSLFQNPDITTSYSPLLQEKNSRNDSLLPALDGDKAFAELLRLHPDFWRLERLDKGGEMVTRLKAKIVYIDGIREDAYCKLDKSASSSAGEWNLEIGVDFVSGASNTVAIHVQQCLNMVRDELGYMVKKDDKIIMVPPKKVLAKIKEVEIPTAIDVDLQQKLLKAHESVELTGNCPKDIESYLILLDVWNQVKEEKMDLVTINDKLNSKVNGGHKIKTCAFSREWNKRYQEDASFECDIDNDLCDFRESEDGNSHWVWNFDRNRFEYKGKKFLFFRIGKQSIHQDGTMMDLRLVRLSTTLYLEGYMDLEGKPVSLGLIILPKDDGEYEGEDEEEDDSGADSNEILDR